MGQIELFRQFVVDARQRACRPSDRVALSVNADRKMTPFGVKVPLQLLEFVGFT